VSRRHIGVTGSRGGGTPRQLEALRVILLRGRQALGYGILHHGDCIGIDAEADALAKELGYLTICHPPEDPRARAHTTDHMAVMDPAPYLERNKQIVEVAEVLLAFPADSKEVLRSGTWATIRWARRVQKTCMIVPPSGVARIEDNDDRISKVS